MFSQGAYDALIILFTSQNVALHAHPAPPMGLFPLEQDPLLLLAHPARKFQKNIYFCFLDYAKPFDCVDHNKLWKNLKEMGIPDHLTCLLRNLYAGQEEQLELEMEQQTGSK